MLDIWKYCFSCEPELKTSVVATADRQRGDMVPVSYDKGVMDIFKLIFLDGCTVHERAAYPQSG